MRRFGLIGAFLILAAWRGEAATTRDAAPPEAGVTAPQAFATGRLVPQLEEQVREIVLAQLQDAQRKGILPPAEEGSVVVSKLEKGTPLSDGGKYPGSVYRPFNVNVDDIQKTQEMNEFYVRTTAPWKFRNGAVAPADTYFSLSNAHVMAFDAAEVSAQDEALAKSQELFKAALDEAEKDCKANLADALQKYQTQMDPLAAKVAALSSDVTGKQNTESAVRAQVNQDLQKAKAAGKSVTSLNGKDSRGNFLWQYQGGQLTFFDNLDKTQKDLAAALQEQADLQAPVTAGQSAARKLLRKKTQALRTAAARQQQRILAGEPLGEDAMRTEYDAALKEVLKGAPASDSTAAEPPKK